MKNEQLLIYQIALTLLDGVGPVNAKNLIAYASGIENVFENTSILNTKDNPKLGTKIAAAIKEQNVIDRAKHELDFIVKNNIRPIHYLDADYPKRLKNEMDSPTLLYAKGNMNLAEQKIISVVGTRNATDYGKKICEEIIRNLSSQNILIVSGLAYGIDICAHRSAIKNDLQTVGVLAHGLHTLYPSQHLKTAQQMLENGGLLTEFSSSHVFHPGNFPSRNRIVAAISDATLVIESAKKGGSLITADIAFSYDRDVFAVPGPAGAKYSEGCNSLVKQNKAALVENAHDILRVLGWEKKKNKKPIQNKLFVELNPEEEKLVNYLKENGKTQIDALCFKAKVPTHTASSLLLTLEFQGVVKSLPGKMYELA